MVNKYIKPETRIVKIESSVILAGSPGNINTEVGGEQYSKQNSFDLFEEEPLPENSDDEDDLWEEEES